MRWHKVVRRGLERLQSAKDEDPAWRPMERACQCIAWPVIASARRQAWKNTHFISSDAPFPHNDVNFEQTLQ